MEKSPEDYRQAALERIEQARANYDRKAFALAMYVAGVAVECMLRAYILRRKGKGQLETGHNILLLLSESQLKSIAVEDKLEKGTVDSVVTRYIDSFEEFATILSLSWANDFRYASEKRLRAELKKRKLTHGVKGDTLKANAIRLIEAASWIVREGERLWKRFEEK
jgi:HEPN domain-containing protein